MARFCSACGARLAADEAQQIGARNARIRVRIAVNAGETFADDGVAVEGRIAGDVLNTAARLQSTAHVGDVLVSGAAERLAQGVPADPGPWELAC